MGWGDEVMVTAIARRMQARDRRPVAVRGRDGWARWSEVWENNPRIAIPGRNASDRVQWLDNFSGNRPYLDYSKFNNRKKSEAYVYTDFRVEPGEIYLDEEERRLGELARGAIIVEPNIKPSASPNKNWGWHRWASLAWELRRQGLRLVQIGAFGVPQLAGVEFVQTDNVRQACGVLSGASLLIAPEGGLHHAAAALGVRAIVLFGGFISPSTTGYDRHINLFTGGRACGMRVPCKHCAEAMAAIAPDEVARQALELMLEAA